MDYLQKKKIGIFTVDNLRTLYLILSLLLFSFVSTEEGTGLPIQVPFYKGLVVYYHMALMAFLVVIFLIMKRGVFKIDVVGALLFVKCITDLVSYAINLNSVPDGYLGYYACSVTALVSYVLCIQSSGNVKKYYKYFIGFGIVIAIQTIWTTFMAGVNFLDIMYKGSMNIPYGASNVIASALVPLIVLPFFMDMKRSIKFILSGLMFLGVVLTKSRGGVLLAIFTIVLAVLFTDLIKKNRQLKRLMIMIAIVLLVAAVMSNEEVEIFLHGYMGNRTGINAFSSNRIEIFIEDFMNAFEKPIFGHGLGVNGASPSGTHNLLIDLFYKCGLVGFMEYGLALYYLIKLKKDKYFAFFALIMFINSMFEVCYFSYKCDTLFWIAAGLSTAGDENEVQYEKGSLPGVL